MVDIAASLSLTPSSLPLDSAAILGAETADNQAFGDILAGQVKAGADNAAIAGLPTLPVIPAGNRQPGGNILPGATQILPGTAQILPPQVSPDAAMTDLAALTAQPVAAQTLPAEAPSAQPAPAPVATKPVLATLAVRLAAPLPQGDDLAPAETPVPQPATTNPVHALLKMVATAIRTPRQAADDETPAAAAEQDAAPETDGAEPAMPAATVAMALPVLPILVAPTLQPTVPVAAPAVAAPATDGATAPAPQAVPVQSFIAHPAKSAAHLTATAALLPTALPQAADAAPREHAQPNQNQPAAAPSVAPQAGTATKAEVPSVPVLTVAAVPTETATAAVAPAQAVTLTPAPVRPTGPVTTARIKVESREPSEGQTLAADRIAASLTPAADRAAVVERVMPTATPIITDSQAGATTAPAAPVTTAPTIAMPRHDFAALVERLVEARNTAAPASTHASINHAEFGQVSLHFQQDGNDLKVGMSSADPGFAAAVQAAMPAERQNMNADTRGQSNQNQNQNQSQSASTSSNSNHEAAGQRGTDTADQQGGRGQGRNSRGGTNNSNPSQRWTGEQPQSRGGIFA